MLDSLIFVFRYFWLFASITLIMIGDVLFIIRSVQEVNETISLYKKNNKDKYYLKGKFTPAIICVLCNVVLIIIMASLLFYCKEVIDMRNIISNMN